MPLGFVITEFTEDQGMSVKLSHPESLEVNLDDMMRIFYAHITGAGEAGNVMVRLEKARSNVSSFFTGMESEVPLMINLMLELGEEPEMFGETVIHDINEVILTYLNRMKAGVSEVYEVVKELRSYLKSALILLDRLKSLSREQRMAQIYNTEKGRAILEILQDAPRTRKELIGMLEEKLNKVISNIEITLDPFIKTGVIRQDWVGENTDISLFLLSDFTIFRAPAVKIIENTKTHLPTPELATKYLKEVKDFFSNYKPTLEDNIKLTQNMLNPDKYDFISLLRERTYPLKKLPKSPGESLDQVSNLLKTMENDQIIKFIKDNKDTIWVFLLSDIVAHTFYPEYLIENIRKYRMEGKISKEIAIKHLELLEAVYKK